MAGKKSTAPETSPDTSPTPPASASSADADLTPIIGIGASAGELEAYEAFFASLLTEILQRSTHMKVIEAQQNMRLKPDCVYVMPPNREMSVAHGSLQLSLPTKPRGHNMPINTFFESMARDYDEAAIGIILSGTGTDGTLGLKAILEAGGMTLVQAPGSAYR